MKTISGEVISSKPICLSRAVKTLSRFASSEIGVSDAVSACLWRAADAFKEVVQLHKDLKALKSRRSPSELESQSKTGDFANFISVKEEEKKKKKKKQRRENEGVSNGGVWESKGKAIDDGEEIETEKQRKKKEKKENREHNEVSNDGVWGSKAKEIDDGEEFEKEKKKNKKEGKEKAEEGENGERIKGEEDKREKKKWNNMDLQENGIEDSEEKHSSKKKNESKIEDDN